MADRSKTDMCNLALYDIGHTKSINDVDTERSEEARVCKGLFDQVLDEVLEDYPWPEATGRAQPAAIDETTLDLGAVPDGWTYAYALPADCVPNGIRKVYPGVRNPRRDQEVPHAIENDARTGQTIILTDEEDPELLYTRRLTNYAKISPSLARAVSTKLGEYIIPALRKELKLVPVQAQKYERALAKATTSAKRGEMPDEDPDPSWIANR